MNYHQITIHTVTEAVEALSDALITLGSGGVEIFDPKDILNQEKDPTAWDYIDEDLMKNLKKDEVLVRAYFSEEVIRTTSDLEEMVQKIRRDLDNISRFLPIGAGTIDIGMVAEEDWMNAWKKYYHPLRVGRHVLIVPSWMEEPSKEGDVRIDLDPGMAFGTGSHETTSMCIEFLEDAVHPGDTVLDIGCGSGILGITAAKLGAGRVICSDLDLNAVKTAGENIIHNHVEDRVKVYPGDLTEIEAFRGVRADVVVSNIIADVIIHLSSTIGLYLKSGGTFICSGIINERRDDVVKALESNGFTVKTIREKGSWTAICCQNA